MNRNELIFWLVTLVPLAVDLTRRLALMAADRWAGTRRPFQPGHSWRPFLQHVGIAVIVWCGRGAHWSLVALLATALLVSGGELLLRAFVALRRDFKAEDDRPQIHRFGGLAGWILAAVFVLAGAGVWSIQRDRELVDEDARRLSARFAASFAADLGPRWSLRLAEAESIGDRWAGDGVLGPPQVFAPGDREVTADVLAARRAATNQWRAEFAGLELAEELPIRLFTSRADEVPVPAGWLTRMTSMESGLWARLQSAEVEAGDLAEVEALMKQLRDLNPSAEVLANVSLWELRAEVRRSAPEGAGGDTARALRQFVLNPANRSFHSPAGLPLDALAMLQLFQTGGAAALDVSTFGALSRCVLLFPSALTEPLLEAAGVLAVAKGGEWPAAIGKLQERRRSVLRRREIERPMVEWIQHSRLAGSSLWWSCAGRRWLVVVQPVTNAAVQLTPWQQPVDPKLPAVKAYSWELLNAALSGVVPEMTPDLPPWSAIEIRVEGEPMKVPSHSSHRIDLSTRALLAIASAPLGSFAFRAGAPEDLPGAVPRLEVRVYLADAVSLYSSQRWRRWMFGALVVTAALVAVFGVLQARRAFRHQVALVEQQAGFVSSVSHELRAPIASVRLMAEALERGAVGDPGRQREYHRMIVEECRRLSGLIENVLDAARIDRGRKEYEFEPTDLRRVVNETVRLAVPIAESRGVKLVSVMPSDSELESVTSIADGRALQRAIANLVDNAIKHSPSGAAVTVAMKVLAVGDVTDGGRGGGAIDAKHRILQVVVEDEGPGIPAGERERIFERFHRLGTELRRETPGVGLGLAIVRHIVTAHGGRVWVEEAPIRGSRFVLNLPLRTEA